MSAVRIQQSVRLTAGQILPSLIDRPPRHHDLPAPLQHSDGARYVDKDVESVHESADVHHVRVVIVQRCYGGSEVDKYAQKGYHAASEFKMLRSNKCTVDF